MGRERLPLSQADQEAVFRISTRALPERYADSIAAGMSDQELTDALARVLGIFGGSCGPGRLDVLHQAAGLKIWGGWHIVNHVTEKPFFFGARARWRWRGWSTVSGTRMIPR